MPRVSELSPEEWREVQTLVVAGMTYREVGEKYDVEPVTIRVKAHREKWPVPNRVEEIRKELTTKRLNEEMDGKGTESNVGSKLAESIAEIGQKGQISVLRGMLPRLLKTFQEDSALLTKEVEDWKTAGSMVNIFSKLSGLDKPQIAIQTNVWGDGWSGQGAVPVEAEDADAS